MQRNVVPKISAQTRKYKCLAEKSRSQELGSQTIDSDATIGARLGDHRDGAQARSTYSDVSVLTMIVSPGAMKGGTEVRTPLSSSAGL